MNNSDIGRVIGYLLKHRYVETKSVRRNISREEREIATMLRDADSQMFGMLGEIFDGQGLMLRSFNDLEVKGIPTGATIFLLARKPDSCPPFFGTERLIEKMRQIGKFTSDTEAKIWFTQLWFLLLDLLYTRKNRSPNSMQEWIDTQFPKFIFVDAVKDYLNDEVRKIDPTTLQTPAIYNTLMKPKEGGVTKLCYAFLDLMTDAGLLDLIDKDLYRQSLLFSYEVSTNYERQLKPILPGDTPFDAASTILISENEKEGEESNVSNN